MQKDIWWNPFYCRLIATKVNFLQHLINVINKMTLLEDLLYYIHFLSCFPHVAEHSFRLGVSESTGLASSSEKRTLFTVGRVLTPSNYYISKWPPRHICDQITKGSIEYVLCTNYWGDQVKNDWFGLGCHLYQCLCHLNDWTLWARHMHPTWAWNQN